MAQSTITYDLSDISVRNIGICMPEDVWRKKSSTFELIFKQRICLLFFAKVYLAEIEFSRTSLASRTSSRTHFEVLGLEASSPWPWPRSLRSSKIALSRKRSRTALFFEPLKFCWKTPETSRKICKYLFCFPQLEHRLSQAGPPPN